MHANVLEILLKGKRKRGIPNRGYLDVVKEKFNRRVGNPPWQHLVG